MEPTEKLLPSCGSAPATNTKSEIPGKKLSDMSKRIRKEIASLKLANSVSDSVMPTTELDRQIHKMRLSLHIPEAELGGKLEKLLEEHEDIYIAQVNRDFERKEHHMEELRDLTKSSFLSISEAMHELTGALKTLQKETEQTLQAAIELLAAISDLEEDLTEEPETPVGGK